MTIRRVRAVAILFLLAFAAPVFAVPFKPPGVFKWVVREGSTGGDAALGVAVDSAGNVFVSGTFSGTTTIAGTSLTSEGATDIFLAKYSSTGAPLWGKRIGGTTTEMPKGIAVDAAGDVVLTGYFEGAVDFGGGALTATPPNGDSDIFLAKYSTSGAHIWSKRFGTSLVDSGYGVAIASANQIVITGSFRSSIDFGGGTLTGTFNEAEVYVAKFSSTGAHVWSRTFTGGSAEFGKHIVVDASDNVVVAGIFQGENFTCGGAAMGNAGTFTYDAFLCRLSSTGTHLWSKRFGDIYDDVPNGLGVTPTGEVVLGGFFGGTVNFGGGALTSTLGSADVFLAKFSATGAHQWSKRFGAIEDDEARGLVVDSIGNVTVVGHFNGTVNFGGSPLTAIGSPDLFVAKYAPGGLHIWSKRFLGGVYDGPVIALYNSGPTSLGTALAGYFFGTANFGGGPVVSAGGGDAFILLLGP